MKIRNKQTGEIIEVTEQDLPKYGISAPQTQTAPTTTQVPVPQSQPNMGGGMNITPQMAAMAQMVLPKEEAAKVMNILKIQQDQQKAIEPSEYEKNRAVDREKSLKNAKGLISVIDDLERQAKETTVLDAINPASAKVKQFEATKNLASQYLAKAIEEGKLSDQDRLFYQQQILNISPYGLNKPKSELLGTIKDNFSKLTGFSPEELGLDKKKDNTQVNTNVTPTVPNTTAQVPNVPTNNVTTPNTLTNSQDSVFETDQTKTAFNQDTGNALFNANRSINQFIGNKLGANVVREKAVGPIVKFLYPKFGSILEKLGDEELGIGGPAKVSDTEIKEAAKELGGAALIDMATMGLFHVGGPIVKKIGSEIVEKPVKAIFSKLANSSIPERTFLSAFTIPSRRGDVSKRLVETAKKMLDYGVTGNLDDMAAKTNIVTGADGELSKVVRNAIGELPNEISTAGVMENVANALKKSPQVYGSAAKQTETAIRNTIPVGKIPSTANALDVFDSIKQLEAMSEQLKNASTYLTKNIRAEQQGDVYAAAAETLKKNLFNEVADKINVQKYLTDDVVERLSTVSPKLAEEARNAKTIYDLRGLQAPFVRLSKMIDLTNQASQSTFNKFAGNVQNIGGKAVSGFTGAATGVAAGGPLGLILGGLAGVGAETALSRPSTRTGGAQLIRKIAAAGLPNVPKGVETGSRDTARVLAQLLQGLISNDRE